VRWIGVCNCGVRDLEEVLACTAIASNQIPYSLLWRATEFEIIDRCVERSISVLCYSPLMQGLLTGKFDSLDDVPHGRRTTRLFSGEEPTTRHGGPGCITEAFAAVDRIRAICNRIDAPMARVALGWLLAQPGVASVLAGARSPAQVEQNAQAADLLLPPGILQELSDATAEVKQIMGAGPDPWQTESRSH
jgi:aryl-alcohol dehydrogenase-like predicted oxidoreductase